MHAGLYFNPQSAGPQSDAEMIEACVLHAKLAEKLGYSAVWLTEHAFTGFNAYSDPIVLAAYLAGAAPKLFLGFAMVIGVYHHPVRFATQVALLDQLTGGRLVCGVSRAESGGAKELEGYGLSTKDDWLKRHQAWREIVENVWSHKESDSPYEFDTPWWKGRLDGRIIPGSVQRPHPPVTEVIMTSEAVRAQARTGVPCILSLSGNKGPLLWNSFLDGLQESDLSNTQKASALEWTSFAQHVYISDGSDPPSEIQEYSEAFLAKSAFLASGANLDRSTLKKRIPGYRNGLLLAGNSQQVLDRLAPWAERGMRHTRIWTMFGHLPPAKAQATIQRFAEDVMPHLERLHVEDPLRA